MNTVAEYMSDPTLKQAHVLESLRVLEGKEATLAGPLFGADFLPGNRRAPPRAGEHTLDVLQSLGYSEADIRQLREKGAVG